MNHKRATPYTPSVHETARDESPAAAQPVDIGQTRAHPPAASHENQPGNYPVNPFTNPSVKNTKRVAPATGQRTLALVSTVLVCALALWLGLWFGVAAAPAPQDQPTATPEQPTPEQPTPEQPTPEQPTPEQPTPEPQPEQPQPEQPQPEQPAPEQPQQVPPDLPTPAPIPTFAPVPPPVPFTAEQIANASVLVPSINPTGTLQLVNGVFSNPNTGVSVSLADVPPANGDLNGDGALDAAVVLNIVLADGTVSTDLSVLGNQGGAPVALAATRLGGPAIVERMRIDRGAIWIDMRIAAINDDPCCPSIHLSRIYIVSGSGLLDLPATATGRLFPYRVGDLYGYVNVLGEFAVTPQYAFAAPFHEGLALVSLDGARFGYINRLGQIKIPLQFSFGSDFSGGVAVVGVPAVAEGQADTVIYIDRNANNLLGAGAFGAGLPFSEGLAAVQSADVNAGGKFGYVNRRGEAVIPAEYDFAFSFSEGLAPVLIGDKVGYINRSGRMVIEAQFDAGDTFSEGLAAVAQAGKVGYIDQTGAFAVQPSYDRAGAFVDGLAPVVVNNAELYIDLQGRSVITQPVFIDAREFSEGLAAVRVDGLYGYLDESGTMAIAPQYTQASDFDDGLAVVETATTWGVIGYDGTVLVQLQKPVVVQPAPAESVASDAAATASLTTTTAPAATPASTATLLTEIVTFLPDVPDELRAGNCFAPSDLVNSPLAFRCGVDNVTYDPCILASDGATVVCGVDPALGAPGFALQLAAPLPAPAPPEKLYPPAWLFQLQNGAICRYNEGTSITVDGQRLNYICSDLTQLFGEIDRSNLLWSANVVTTTDDGQGNYTVAALTPTAIVRVWTPAAAGAAQPAPQVQLPTPTPTAPEGQ